MWRLVVSLRWAPSRKIGIGAQQVRLTTVINLKTKTQPQIMVELGLSLNVLSLKPA